MQWVTSGRAAQDGCTGRKMTPSARPAVKLLLEERDEG